MRLVAHEEGRSLQLISMEEVRPLRGGIHPPDLLSIIIQRYRFVSYPQSYEPNKAVKLETGVIDISSITIPVLAMEIYQDGLLISTRNTEDSDLVLDEFIDWLVRDFGFRPPITIVPRKYTSRMVVDIDGELEGLISSLRVLGEVASAAFNAVDLSVNNLQVGPFPPGQYPYQATWSLARRILDPLIRTRYLSSAPLSSPDHFEFLLNVERALGRGENAC
jgi:hypothetical protein